MKCSKSEDIMAGVATALMLGICLGLLITMLFGCVTVRYPNCPVSPTPSPEMSIPEKGGHRG